MIKHTLVMTGSAYKPLWNHYTETSGDGYKSFGRFVAAMTNAKVTGNIIDDYLLTFTNEKDYIMFKLRWS